MADPLILVVEDNPSDVFILRRTLLDQEEEINLRVACDGEEAIQFLCEHGDNPSELHPCVIVLDLHLPKQDGLEVLHILREKPAFNHIPVVVLTGGASPQEEAALHSFGLDCRGKPTSLSEFDELAAELIAICKSSRSLAQSGRH